MTDAPLPDEPERPAPHVLVLFGATGDLAARKLLPGFFHLWRAGLMPGDFRIVGSGRHEPGEDGEDPSEAFRTLAREALDEHGRHEVDDEAWEAFGPRLSFVASSAEDGEDLATAVQEAADALDGDAERLIYLSVPPKAMQDMVRMLGESGLAEGARVVMEKPFGTDLDSAKALDATIHEVLGEDAVFRIDHFLGKEAAQNLLAFRFANGLFEPVWNRDHVASVQIDVPEDLGLEGRAAFYEETGCLRDMIVTHLFQLLGFVAMEPPVHLDARRLRDEKAKVFDAVRPLDPAEVVRGQYEGYRDEEDVSGDSDVETFVALRAHVETWRWSGVPFYLRTGKAMAAGRRTITVAFHEPPLRMFGERPAGHPNGDDGRAEGTDATLGAADPGEGAAGEGSRIGARTGGGPTGAGDGADDAGTGDAGGEGAGARGAPAPTPRPNELVFELTDEPQITIGLRGKVPGPALALGSAELGLDFGEAFASADPLEAYERLLLDVMHGDHTLFTRSDEIERLWAVCAPALEDGSPPEPYAQGSWGPQAALDLPGGAGWRLPEDGS